MGIYFSCRNCGNVEPSTKLYWCWGGHRYCQECSIVTIYDPIGDSCPICEKGHKETYGRISKGNESDDKDIGDEDNIDYDDEAYNNEDYSSNSSTYTCSTSSNDMVELILSFGGVGLAISLLMVVLKSCKTFRYDLQAGKLYYDSNYVFKYFLVAPLIGVLIGVVLGVSKKK